MPMLMPVRTVTRARRGRAQRRDTHLQVRPSRCICISRVQATRMQVRWDICRLSWRRCRLLRSWIAKRAIEVMEAMKPGKVCVGGTMQEKPVREARRLQAVPSPLSSCPPPAQILTPPPGGARSIRMRMHQAVARPHHTTLHAPTPACQPVYCEETRLRTSKPCLLPTSPLRPTPPPGCLLLHNLGRQCGAGHPRHFGICYIAHI